MLKVKNLNSIEKFLFFILIGSLFIDNINGFLLLEKIDLPMSVGQLYRLFMLVSFGYLLARYSTKKMRMYAIFIGSFLFLLPIFYFLEHHQLAGMIEDYLFITKLLLPFLIIYTFRCLRQHQILKKGFLETIFYWFMVIVPFTLIVPKILNIGYDSYKLGGGFKGFYYANNEINIFLICTSIFAIDHFVQSILNHKMDFKFACFTVLNFTALFMIGSKTSLLAIVLILLIYLWKLRKRKKLLLGFIFVLLLGSLLLGVVFRKQIVEMIERLLYYFNRFASPDSQEGGSIFDFLFSLRNQRFYPSFALNILENPLGVFHFLFGVGHFSQVDLSVLETLMEMDFFDTFLWYGVIVSFAVLILYFTFFYRSFQKKGRFLYQLMFLFCYFFAFLAGHVWYSALAGGIFALVCVGLDEEISNES